ncbi:MAG TPA: hypothetical protein VEC76_03265, partial [Streptosporangiaceae bacterium]|nr:hypothetical protein [Streptosporangiaceae bacterium]
MTARSRLSRAARAMLGTAVAPPGRRPSGGAPAGIGTPGDGGAADAIAGGRGEQLAGSEPWDVQAVRGHFVFPGLGRVVTNNAASTQPPAELLELYGVLGAGYENVHRGQSAASRAMTARFEESYDTFAAFVGAPG